jgi:DNA repair protein RecO (recombination protein O)
MTLRAARQLARCRMPALPCTAAGRRLPQHGLGLRPRPCAQRRSCRDARPRHIGRLHWLHAGTGSRSAQRYDLAMCRLSTGRVDQALQFAAQCLAACNQHDAPASTPSPMKLARAARASATRPLGAVAAAEAAFAKATIDDRAPAEPPSLRCAPRVMVCSVASPLSAYVLHRYDWSESSLILDLFTRERGRLAVAAKGAKRPYSQLRVVLLPFQRLYVSLGRGADEQGAEVQTLRAAEWAGGMPMPSGGALFPGFYLNELLLRLLARQDPHPRLFDAYAQVLPALSEPDDAQAQAALRAFELTLLREIGVLPDLSGVTAAAVHPTRLHAAPEAGVTAAARGVRGITGGDLLALQAALDGDDLAAPARAMPGRTRHCAAAARALAYHLGRCPCARASAARVAAAAVEDAAMNPLVTAGAHAATRCALSVNVNKVALVLCATSASRRDARGQPGRLPVRRASRCIRGPTSATSGPPTCGTWPLC